MSSRTNYTQFSIMAEFMQKHGDLSKPQALPNGRLWCIGKWKELTNLLNSEGSGETRSEEKWRQVWSDLKNNTKRKWAKIHRSVQGTGGGPALKLCLSDIENRVMHIIGVQAAIGMPLAELGFGVVDDSTVSITIESQIDVPMNLAAETLIIGDEDWNTPRSSIDPGQILPEQHELPVNPIIPDTPPVTASSPRTPAKSPAPTFHHNQFTSPPPPQ